MSMSTLSKCDKESTTKKSNSNIALTNIANKLGLKVEKGDNPKAVFENFLLKLKVKPDKINESIASIINSVTSAANAAS